MDCPAVAMGSVVLNVCAVAVFTAINIDAAELWSMLRPVALAAALASVVYLPKACKLVAVEGDGNLKAKAPYHVFNRYLVAFLGVVAVLQLSYSAQRTAKDRRDRHLHIANIVLQVLVILSLCLVLKVGVKPISEGAKA